jgi:hypothetical protein
MIAGVTVHYSVRTDSLMNDEERMTKRFSLGAQRPLVLDNTHELGGLCEQASASGVRQSSAAFQINLT